MIFDLCLETLSLISPGYKGTHESSLAAVWRELGYKDEENFPNLGDEHVTASLYIPTQGKMLMGMRDGYIVSIFIIIVITLFMQICHNMICKVGYDSWCIADAQVSRHICELVASRFLSDTSQWKNCSRAMRGHR